MGKTSSAVKDRYNAKAYDQMTIRLPKGEKARFQEACARRGDSMNSVINEAIRAYMEKV